MDGQLPRELPRLSRRSLSAAEQAIEALGRADAVGARMAIAEAAEGAAALASLVDAVHLAATELVESSEISQATWNQLADAAGPGSLQGLVESVRR